ncbi:MAG: hypothetical protein AAGH19_07095 [Pseudomonadota bacterium]
MNDDAKYKQREHGPEGPLGRAPGHGGEDPLGLGTLPLLDPRSDDWAQVRAALEALPADEAPAETSGTQDARSTDRRSRIPILAIAASLVLAVLVVLTMDKSGTGSGPAEGTDLALAPQELEADLQGAPGAQTEQDVAEREASLEELIAFSQGLERRLRTLREETPAMPAASALYLAELEDMVARVDNQLSDTPGSLELWSQRVNLLLDLEALFQHRFEREYGQMASL